MEQAELRWGRPQLLPLQEEALEVVRSYPLETKRHELWGNIVQQYAPSLIDSDPSLTVATTTLPIGKRKDAAVIRNTVAEEISQNTRFQILFDTSATDSGAVTAQLALHAGMHYPKIAGIHSDFLNQIIEPLAKTPTAVGLHAITRDQTGSGIIFLPTDTYDAKSWEIFYGLSTILGQDGQRLIVKYCAAGLASLAQDLEAHAHNPTVIDLQKRMSQEGYYELLSLAYEGAHNESSKKAAYITIKSKVPSDTPEQAMRYASALIGEIGPKGIPNLPIVRKMTNEDEVSTKMYEAAVALDSSYCAVRKIAQESIGLSLSIAELQKRYPDRQDLAAHVLSALVFLDVIHNHPYIDVKRNGTDMRTIVTPATLQLIRRDIASIYNSAGRSSMTIQGLSDAVFSHELLHGALAALAEKENQNKPERHVYRSGDEEENVIEAINITLGFRNTVEQCTYYADDPTRKHDIETKVRMFSSYVPAERERLLRTFVADNRFPHR